MKSKKKTPEFIGNYASISQEFIAYKRSIGFKYEAEEKIMSRFSKFSKDSPLDVIILEKSLVEAFITTKPNEQPKTRQLRISVIRQFAYYLISLGYDAYVVPPQRRVNTTTFVPYIFTHNEITKIFKTADAIRKNSSSPYIHKILPVLIRVLYGTGLRISEALKLRVQDVYLEDGYFMIREAKFDKERLIPMSESLLATCKTYKNTMELMDDDYFFPSIDYSQLSPNTIYNRFRKILWDSHIPYGGKGSGPRLHDLRHTCAVHALNNWVQDEKDVYSLLPVLSKFLGHESIRSTERYLRLTAEIYPDIIQKTSDICGYVIPMYTQPESLAETGDIHAAN